MTRPAARTTAANSQAHRQLGDLLARMVRENDGRVPAGRRVPRTLQEMQERMPGYERQPVLTLHRPVMADDACPLCGRWNCTGADCPPASIAPAPAPAPATAGGGMQCDMCGGVFGAAPGASGKPTAWTCGACQNLGL
ncbi:hypothetical protein Spa2297_34165 (plasmid) [Streptomyces parvulus]|uniref:4Fe-4S ferredoxin-type domain-containing protein n=2 Tax=Streptomyces parvulus TaxID=146923 RepID=A0A191VB02_9ACTN|nr:hypothetical protein Spa2297_34165 [Streptomyces parvulus]